MQAHAERHLSGELTNQPCVITEVHQPAGDSLNYILPRPIKLSCISSKGWCTVQARQTDLLTVGVGRCTHAQVREQLHMQKRTAGNRWVRDSVTQRHVKRDVPWGLQDGSATLPVIDAARAAHLALPLVGAVSCSTWQAAHHPMRFRSPTLLRLLVSVL